MGELRGDLVFGIQAEAMVAIQAMQVVEDRLIHEVAKRGANGSTSNTTDKAAEQGSGEAAKNGAGRACESANSGADTSTRRGSGNARGDTSNGADRTAYLSAMVGRLDFD